MTWNPFRKKEEAQVPVEQAPKKTADPSEKKGRPTPKMKQAQAAGIRPLVPVDRKASAKAAKARLREKENAEYERCRRAISTTCPRRNACLGVSTSVIMWMPVSTLANGSSVAFAILIVSMFVTSLMQNQWASIIMMALMYGYLIAVIIDVWLMWRKLKAKLIAKYGEQSVSKGSRSFSYAWSRSIQMRRWSFPSRVTRSAVTGRQTDVHIYSGSPR